VIEVLQKLMQSLPSSDDMERAINTNERWFMDIDLSTPEEVEFRFNQICACFAILVRDKIEPQDVYAELFFVANALKEKFCQIMEDDCK